MAGAPLGTASPVFVVALAMVQPMALLGLRGEDRDEGPMRLLTLPADVAPTRVGLGLVNLDEGFCGFCGCLRRVCFRKRVRASGGLLLAKYFAFRPNL